MRARDFFACRCGRVVLKLEKTCPHCGRLFSVADVLARIKRERARRWGDRSLEKVVKAYNRLKRLLSKSAVGGETMVKACPRCGAPAVEHAGDFWEFECGTALYVRRDTPSGVPEEHLEGPCAEPLVFITTTFTPSMLPPMFELPPQEHVAAVTAEVDHDDVYDLLSRTEPEQVRGAVGHENTARVIERLLGDALPEGVSLFARRNISLRAGDKVIAVIPQFRADKAREFTNEEISSANFRFFVTRVLPQWEAPSVMSD